MTDPARETTNESGFGESPTDAARELLESVRREEPTKTPLRTLADATEAELSPVRTHRREGLAFWLNVYNAATQLLLDRRPDLFESRRRFFRAPAVTVAGVELSLDDIEHGIVRGGRSKYGLGYLPRLERTGLGTDYRLDPDPRAHFALNCGAESCPPIAAYSVNDIDAELDMSTRSFLDGSSTHNRTAGEVWVTRLFLYYRGDFGGRRGIYEFLERYGVIDGGERPRVRYEEYDWTLHMGMYRDGSV